MLEPGNQNTLGTCVTFWAAVVTAGHLVFSFSIAASSPTRLKIEKINNLFQVDINRSEQGCAAYYEQHCQHVVTALFNCNNLEQHGWQLVHSWPHNIVHACRYQLGTTCAFLAVYPIPSPNVCNERLVIIELFLNF